jgi:hypothetical protein
MDISVPLLLFLKANLICLAGRDHAGYVGGASYSYWWVGLCGRIHTGVMLKTRGFTGAILNMQQETGAMLNTWQETGAMLNTRQETGAMLNMRQETGAMLQETGARASRDLQGHRIFWTF